MHSDLLTGAGIGALVIGGVAKFGPGLLKNANDAYAAMVSRQRLALETQKETREERKGIVEERDRYYTGMIERDRTIQGLERAAFEKEQRCIQAGRPCDKFLTTLPIVTPLPESEKA